MERRHRSGGGKDLMHWKTCKQIRRGGKGGGGATRGRQEPARGWQQGRARLSCDPGTLPAFCSLHRLFLILDLFSLSGHYLHFNSFNIQSDCKSNPAHCKTSRILPKEVNTYL